MLLVGSERNSRFGLNPDSYRETSKVGVVRAIKRCRIVNPYQQHNFRVTAVPAGKFSPALKLYERLGFKITTEVGERFFMEWKER